MVLRIMITLYFLIHMQAIHAHEFWISPVNYQIEQGKIVQANFRIGSNFSGARYGFLKLRSLRSDVAINGTLQNIPAISGDRPALSIPDLPQGLAVLIHETTDSTLTYKEWEKFEGFTTEKGFADAQIKHIIRGLPKTGFKESYRRYAKSLVAVGSGAGQDKYFGMDIEITALKNPYTDDLSQGLPIKLHQMGAVKPNAQITVFMRVGENVSVELYSTDADGVALIPVQKGAEYLIDHVALQERDPQGDENAPVWHSIWASLTFKTP